MNVRQLNHKFMTAVIAIFLSGCISDSSASYEKALSEITASNQSHYFVVGETTKKDAFELLGPSQQQVDKNNGEVEWRYFYHKEAVYVPVITPIPIKLIASKRICLLFDNKNVLKEVSFIEK